MSKNQAAARERRARSPTRQRLRRQTCSRFLAGQVRWSERPAKGVVNRFAHGVPFCIQARADGDPRCVQEAAGEDQLSEVRFDIL